VLVESSGRRRKRCLPPSAKRACPLEIEVLGELFGRRMRCLPPSAKRACPLEIEVLGEIFGRRRKRCLPPSAKRACPLQIACSAQRLRALRRGEIQCERPLARSV
jgi:hypothetical protein